MHQETLREIVSEVDALLRGRFLGRVFQLNLHAVAIDFGIRNAAYLFISIDPAAPRLHLITRSSRQLEKLSILPNSFAQALRTNFGGGRLLSVTKDANDRVVRLAFDVTDELGETHSRSLIAQLTGRSANLFLLDSESRVTHALRAPRGEGQQFGEVYTPPTRQATSASEAHQILRESFATISAAADDYYRKIEDEQTFLGHAAELLAQLRKEINRRKKLKANLEKDRLGHGLPVEHKRLGDLLLANIASAVRKGNSVRLQDYYAEGAPVIEIEVDENTSLQDAAAESFSRYGKAKRAIEEIGSRLAQTAKEVADLESKLTRLENAIAQRDVEAMAEFAKPKQREANREKKRSKSSSASLAGMRRYLSSDSYEVIVGRSARDNDQLTFKVARPNDLWMHAGDYPGSHVIIRNASKAEIPHRTIIEAAQLAAKFSQASKDSKVTVHYTPRKFISKPKGAAPGLVRMSSFRSIIVEPGETMERL
ncbi:MAG TPA: NFACT RNA binding domain-containing protein [Pyrinomonadaceae bacterium]|nr:NFACT RNA binding domain-containing protein [Pyrinomonadaceae bacterium]